MLVGAALGAVSWIASDRTALADLTFKPGRKDTDGNVIVVIFLRGGMDGLNVVVPYREDAYYRGRPSLALGKPGSRKDAVLDLNGNFGFHPAMAPLLPLYHDGKLACLHAVGSQDGTLSHFEAMAAMERGLARMGPGQVSGWLARHLNSTEPSRATPLRAVALSSVMPDSLRGGTDVIALESLDQFQLRLPNAAPKEHLALFKESLRDLYADGKDAMAEGGRETLAVLDTLNNLDVKGYKPFGGAAYPDSDLGQGLKQTALLVKAGVGLEIACLDKGGWDTHVTQGSSTGWQATQLDDLAKSLAAFCTDLGPGLDRVTTIVMTEFGRRAYENSGLGTDHGRGSAMFLAGGGVKGGQVYANWPGLEETQLEPPGDLRVTTDYRNVLGEVLSKRAGNERLGEVFPDFTPAFPGLIA